MALFWPILEFLIRLETRRGAVLHGRGRCSSTGGGIRTSAPVSGPGAARLQPAGTRHPEPEASRNPEPKPAGTRNPEPEARIQGQILHMSEEINVSRTSNVIIRRKKIKIFIINFQVVYRFLRQNPSIRQREIYVLDRYKKNGE